MEIKEVLRTAIQDWIVPELDKIRLENAEIRSTLQLTNKRLDDIQAQLIDQSRRIDETNQRIDKVHDDLLARIDKVHDDLLARIDETNRRIDKVHDDLLARIDETNRRIDKVHDDLLARIDETNRRIDKVHDDLLARIDQTNRRIDHANVRLDRLYEVVVKREEHNELESRVAHLEEVVKSLRQSLAA
ncbi:MAG: coiled-coil domain-containing protein [Thiobacillaceae bacterium]